MTIVKVISIYTQGKLFLLAFPWQLKYTSRWSSKPLRICGQPYSRHFIEFFAKRAINTQQQLAEVKLSINIYNYNYIKGKRWLPERTCAERVIVGFTLTIYRPGKRIKKKLILLSRVQGQYCTFRRNTEIHPRKFSKRLKKL